MLRFGVTTFPTDYGLSVVDLARAVEERGLDSILFNEHTHIPVRRICIPRRWRTSQGIVEHA